MLQRAIEIKGWLVHQDPEDHGVRQVLNLGHTLGHALEAWSRYRIRHGMAVAWGMIRELWMGVAAGLTPEQLAEDITDRLSQGRLLPDIAPPPWEQLLPHLLRDKKRASRGSLTLIFLRAPGAPLRHTMSLEEARRLYKISLDLYRA
jgi:3-dehydroquinate synthase